VHLQGAWKGAWKKARQADTYVAAAPPVAAAAGDEADPEELQTQDDPDYAPPGAERRRNSGADEAPRRVSTRQPNSSAALAIAALEEIKASGGSRFNTLLGSGGSLPPLPPRVLHGSPVGPSRASSLQQAYSISEPNLKVIRNGKKRRPAAPRAASAFTAARMPWLSSDSQDEEDDEQQQQGMDVDMSEDQQELEHHHHHRASRSRFRHRGGPWRSHGASPTHRSGLVNASRVFHSGLNGRSAGAEARGAGGSKEPRQLLYTSGKGALQNLLQAVGELQNNTRWLPQQLAARAAVAALGPSPPARPAGSGTNGSSRQHTNLVLSLLLANLPSMEVIQQHVPLALEHGSRLPSSMPKPPVPLFKEDE
jgi:hypothetical protein